MMVQKLEKAILEAKRFLATADVLRKDGVVSFKRYEGGANAAAVKRASMDLTKALVSVRR